MAEIIVTSTADSGAGSLRQAIADAADGDVILFDSDVFPAGQTTSILLSSYITFSKSISIYGGFNDGAGGYTSGASKRFYVYREIDGVKTKVYVTDDSPAQEGETVLFENVCRVALDGQRAVAITRFSSNKTLTCCGAEYKNGYTTNGGGAYHYGYSETTFIDCNFTSCEGTTSAGAIRTDADAIFTINNCAFTNCESKDGGAIFSAQRAVSTLNNCCFDSCSASNNGGGVYHANTSQNTLNDCTFDGCSALNGGSIYSSSTSQNTLTNCTFDGCSATNVGGALYIRSGQNVLNNCIFDSCNATSGGGVYSTSTSQNTLNNCNITGCNATNYGGAVYSTNTSANTFTDCTFSTNTANSGGAVSSYGTSANTFTDCTFSTNTANYGGAVRVNSAGFVSFVGETTTIKDCEAATGSGIYHSSIRAIVGTPSLENCEVVYDVDAATRTTRYFTTTADSGTGSLRAVLAECAANDTVEPDPETFAVGSTVTILLASPITVAKRVRLKGAGRKIVLDGQGACRCVIVNDGQAFDAEDVAIVGGYTTANTGSALTLTGSSGVILTRSVVAGAYGYRPIYTSSNGGVLAISSVIAGNYATNAWPGCPLRGVGSTICGNYLNGAHSNSNAYGDGSIYNATPSEAGFVVAPPDTLAAEDFDKDLWKQWDLSLTSESSYATTTADDWDGADLWADGDDWRYDTLGLPRKANGASGAYERYDFDYYQGDTATSFASPTGWYTDRLLTTPATTIDRGGSFFIDKAATLAGTLTTNATVTVALNADVVFSEYIQAHRLTLGIDTSATFDLGATFTNVETSDKSEIQSTASFTVDVLDINGSSSFVFAPEDSTETATVANAVYTQWGGDVTVTSSGYVSVPTDADLTFFVDLNNRVIRRGAGVTAITAEVVGSTLAPTITRTSDDGDVGLEYESASDAWTYLGKAGTATTPIAPETSVAVRAFDGENFVYGVATRTYYYIGGAEGSFTTPGDWSLVRNGTALNVAPTVKGCKFIVGDISSGE